MHIIPKKADKVIHIGGRCSACRSNKRRNSKLCPSCSRFQGIKDRFHERFEKEITTLGESFQAYYRTEYRNARSLERIVEILRGLESLFRSERNIRGVHLVQEMRYYFQPEEPVPPGPYAA